MLRLIFKSGFFIHVKIHFSVVFALFSKVPKFLGKSFIYLNDYEINTLITYKHIHMCIS